MQIFTRAELYELVWSEPRLRLGKRLGASDVWIGKACRNANIPTPSAGHWARVEAGKSYRRPTLPPRGPGQSDDVVLVRERYSYGVSTIQSVPREPIFTESVEVVRGRAVAALGRSRAPRDLACPVVAVAKVLKDEDNRRAETAKAQYSWNRPRFESPAARRRLYLINALLTLLERVGCKADVDRHSLDVSVVVGDTRLGLILYAYGRRPAESYERRSLDLADVDRGRLVLEVNHHKLQGIRHEWQDTEALKLEKQLSGIAVELLVTAEMVYRQHQINHRAWIIKRNADIQAEAIRAREESERKEKERLARIEKAKVAHLLRMADRLRKANEIRDLVAAMVGTEASVTFDEWKVWALAVAEGLDPRSSAETALRLLVDAGAEVERETE